MSPYSVPVGYFCLQPFFCLSLVSMIIFACGDSSKKNKRKRNDGGGGAGCGGGGGCGWGGGGTAC